MSADDTETTRILADWGDALAGELGLAGLEVDIDEILALAGTAAHAVLRPAAPLTTYLVGYAAGRAAASQQVSGEQATQNASAVASRLATARAQHPSA